MIRATIALLLLATLLVLSRAGVAAQSTATPTQGNTIPGGVGIAIRTFRANDPSRTLIFAVSEYDSVEHAQGAVPLLLRALVGAIPGVDPGAVVGMRRVEVPPLRDESWAYVTDPGSVRGTEEIAVLFVRRDRYLWAMAGTGPTGMMADVRAIADRVPFEGAAGTPVVARGYHSGGLWDRLPRVEHLPIGYALQAEEGSGVP